jgi:hypothetical protein
LPGDGSARKRFDQTADGLRGQQSVAAGDHPDRVDQLGRFDTLAQEAAGPGPDRVEHVLVHLERGQDQHLHPRQRLVRGDHPGRSETVHLRHPDVHQHHVGPLGPGQFDRVPPVRRLSDDLQVRR